jgi:hypothetical protein
MLTFKDFGCCLHQPSQVIFKGHEAKVMQDILYNLPQDGAGHFYICDYGSSHRITFNKNLVSCDAQMQRAPKEILQTQCHFKDVRAIESGAGQG